MNAWQVAWRLRDVALAASVTPFVLNTVLYLATRQIFSTYGPGEMASLVMGMLYQVPDALFIAIVLEAMLAAEGVKHWRQALLPSRRALLFALAMAPFALLTTILLYGVRWPIQTVLFDGGGFGLGERLAFTVLYQAGWDWLLLGLLVAPLAVRILALPRLVRRPRAGPDAGLFGTIVVAVALSIAVAAASTLLAQLAGQIAAPAETAIQWAGGYLASLLLLTPIAGAAGALLVRRAAQPAEA